MEQTSLIVPPRRRFLRGLAGILAAGMAPAIITTPGLLMPVKPLPAEFQSLTWTYTEGGVITANFQVIVREMVENLGGDPKWLVQETELGKFTINGEANVPA